MNGLTSNFVCTPTFERGITIERLNTVAIACGVIGFAIICIGAVPLWMMGTVLGNSCRVVDHTRCIETMDRALHLAYELLFVGTAIGMCGYACFLLKSRAEERKKMLKQMDALHQQV